MAAGRQGRQSGRGGYGPTHGKVSTRPAGMRAEVYRLACVSPIPGAHPPVRSAARALLRTLLYLQALAFRRAPYLGGRIALAVLKGLGLVYAVASAAALGFLLPDTLSVWAPGVSALAVVEQALLPALGLLTVGRVLFQDVPTRGAEVFLVLPVSRRRVARAVTVRSVLTVFNVAPLAFAVPFAARTVREAAGSYGWAHVRPRRGRARGGVARRRRRVEDAARDRAGRDGGGRRRGARGRRRRSRSRRAACSGRALR